MKVNPFPSRITPYYPMYKYRRITPPPSWDSIYLLLQFLHCKPFQKVICAKRKVLGISVPKNDWHFLVLISQYVVYSPFKVSRVLIIQRLLWFSIFDSIESTELLRTTNKLLATEQWTKEYRLNWLQEPSVDTNYKLIWLVRLAVANDLK